MSNKVFIVGGDSSYGSMFKSKGWDIIHRVGGADLVQFTGGEDVSPILYYEPKHHSTYSSENRDLREELIYKEALRLGVPMSGICRGGQFLNVMCNGSLYQDVTAHAICDGHLAYTKDGRTMTVSSTHHQMMLPDPFGDVVLFASNGSIGEKYNNLSQEFVREQIRLECEAVIYRVQRVLCFQPHPEFYEGEMRDLYFEFLEEIL